MKQNMEQKKLDQLVENLCSTYDDQKGINNIEGLNLPERAKIYAILDDLFALLFPGYFEGYSVVKSNLKYFVGDKLENIYVQMMEQCLKAFRYKCRNDDTCTAEGCQFRAHSATLSFLDTLPSLREIFKTDVCAALDGDPAAHDLDEIILSYPCIEAIVTYRIAHLLYASNVPLIPRMMTERAHHRTGIDIHPGATIGRSFFIDHGTGVVIGETCTIGETVKIYQGVTLGALSFPKDANGNIIKGQKRHPTLENNVTIYAGATILGGETIIGDGAVIGGNVWITESVPAGARVMIKKPDLVIKK